PCRPQARRRDRAVGHSRGALRAAALALRRELPRLPQPRAGHGRRGPRGCRLRGRERVPLHGHASRRARRGLERGRDDPPERRPGSPRRGLDPTLLLIAPAALCVLGLFVYPFVYGLALSFQPYGDNEANGPLGSYLAFFGDPRERLSIWNTLRLAVPATFIDVAVALPL